MPSGSYNPFPENQSSSSSSSKDKQSQNSADAGEQSPPSGQQDSRAGGASEDDTLAGALEEFERARRQGELESQGEQSAAGEETDFPILLPPSGDAGDGIEQSAGMEGDAQEAEQGGAPGDPGGAQTANEKIAVLDGQLEAAYGQFEGMILRERDYVRGKENARGADIGDEEEAGGGLGGEGAAGDPAGQDGSGEQPEPISGSGTGTRPSGADEREGEYQHAAVTHKPPPDIPDGSDDDVVARQLREAAMREPDPELREKLWDEYRKYKNKSKGG